MSRTRPQVPDCASADGGAGGEVSPRLSPTPRVAGGSWMEERVDNRGMTDSWEWDETLYAQSAGFYVAGRLAYPKQMAAQIVSAVGLGADSRALDVGCGPGSLTLLLAPLVDQIVGIDADAGMIAEVRLAARRAGIGNVAWRRLRGEQLPAGLGDFDLATFAQSLHWMKRVEVLGLVRTMLREGGASRGSSDRDSSPSHAARSSSAPSITSSQQRSLSQAPRLISSQTATPSSRPDSGISCRPPRTTMTCSANERATSSSTFGDLNSIRPDVAKSPASAWSPHQRRRPSARSRQIADGGDFILRHRS
jgi:hypothetical protein